MFDKKINEFESATHSARELRASFGFTIHIQQEKIITLLTPSTEDKE